jgi:hypothetical protein
MKNFEFYITMNVESPDFEDFAKARSDLYELGIDEQRAKIGIMLTKIQWVNLRRNLSRFEMRMVNPIGFENQIMGFPVKIVEFEVIQK